MQPEKLQRLKSKIVEAVPEIMELKDGCRVQYEFIHGGVAFEGTFLGNMFRTNKDDQWGLRVANCIMPIPNRHHFQKTAKILGRPIKIEDVLRALQETEWWNGFNVCLDNEAGVSQIYTENGTSHSWTLGLPLDSQPEETISFLFQLLCE